MNTIKTHNILNYLRYTLDISIILEILTVICISRLQTLRSCSLLTYIRLRANFLPLLPLTRKTIAKPPTKKYDRKYEPKTNSSNYVCMLNLKKQVHSFKLLNRILKFHNYYRLNNEWWSFNKEFNVFITSSKNCE